MRVITEERLKAVLREIDSDNYTEHFLEDRLMAAVVDIKTQKEAKLEKLAEITEEIYEVIAEHRRGKRPIATKKQLIDRFGQFYKVKHIKKALKDMDYRGF